MASIAGALGGGIAGAFKCAAGAYGISNTLTVTVLVEHGFLGMIIAILVAMIVSFALTFFCGYQDEESADAEENNQEKAIAAQDAVETPVVGEKVDLSEVKDEAFSSQSLGKTIAIHPTVGEIYAPEDADGSGECPQGRNVGRYLWKTGRGPGAYRTVCADGCG